MRWEPADVALLIFIVWVLGMITLGTVKWMGII